MSNLHQAYLKETGGRKLPYAAWLEQKLNEFAAAYEDMLLLVQDAHQKLLTGTEDERRKLAHEIAIGFKDTGLFDEPQGEEVKQ